MILVDDALIFSDSSGKIFALDSQMSTIKWQIEVPGAVVGGVVELPDGFAVVLLENETSLVKTFDFDGGAKWEASLSGEVFQAPVVNESLLVVGTLNGDNLLYAYNLTGVQVWSYNPER
jgi:outer membrane protein assembly factor BamB